MKNVILKYGIYSGVLSAAFMLMMAFRMNNSETLEGGEIYGYAGMILSMLFVFVGVRVFRDKERNGVITFGEAFLVGGMIALISCLFYVATWMIVYQYMMPDFLEKYAVMAMEKMKASGATEEKLQQMATEMDHYKEMYKNPVTRAGLTFLEPLPVALIMSLISAAILRKKAN